MSDDKRYQIAKAYIDRQIKKLERRGSITKKISDQKYKELVKRTAQVTNA